MGAFPPIRRQWLCILFGKSRGLRRDGFRKRGALGHCNFWGPTQVQPIWSLVSKAWKYALLMCSTPSKT